MKNQKETRTIAILTCLVLIAVVASVGYVFNLYSEKINSKVSDYKNQYLSDVMDESAERIAAKINENFSALEVLSLLIGEYEDITSSEVDQMLSQHINGITANKYNVIKKDGTSIKPLNQENYIENSHIEKALKGSGAISDIIVSEDEMMREIIFVVPIYNGPQIVGALELSYNLETFAKLTGDVVLSKKADIFIIQKDGTLVSRPETATSGANIFSILESIMVDEGSVIKSLRNNIEKDLTGNLVIGEDKYKRYICYNHIPENDWYVVTIMSANVVENDIYIVSELAVELGKMIIAVFVLLIIYLMIVYLRTIMNTRLNYKRYRIVADQSSSIIFEYNYDKDRAFHTSKWREKFGYEPFETNYIENMTKEDVIVPDDVEAFESLFQQLRQGRSLVEKEIRIYDKDKVPRWILMKATAIRKHGKIKKIIGRYIDIDKSKKEIEYLRDKSEKDKDTGLYNRETVERMTNDYTIIEDKETVGALFYIDIDNLKFINDSYGHKLGDMLVDSVVSVIKDNIKEDEFAGRITGDEFVVVLKSIEDTSNALERANKLIDEVSKLKFTRYKKVELTISLGIAMIPTTAKNSCDIITAANKAMYVAKKSGKGVAKISNENE